MISSRRILEGAATVALAAVAAVAQAFTVPSLSGPGVPSPGYPDFWAADATASLNQNPDGTFTLSLSGNSASCGSKAFANCSEAIFNWPNGAYLVGSEKLNITANFGASGTFLGGKYEIDGTLAASSNPSFHTAPPPGVSWSAVTQARDLFSTTLTSVTVDSKDGALGFGTADFGGWANQPQFTAGGRTSESLWLYALLTHNDQGNSNWQGNDNGQNYDWIQFLADLKSGKGLKPHTFYGIASINTVPIPGAVWLLGGGLAALGGLLRRRKASSPLAA